MRLNSWLIFTVCCNTLLAQVNTAFIEHLSAHDLLREHRAYLNTLPQQKDSTFYFEAKFHLKYFNDSLFINYYKKCNGLCSADSAINIKAGRAFLLGNHKGTRATWFTVLNTGEKSKGEVWLHTIYKASLNPNIYAKEMFPDELQSSFSSYKRAYNKKPLLGAMLSSVVPGLGKLYAGKPKSSLLTFLLNAGYAAQTIESGKKLGIKNPFTIINAAAFAVFYLANIYGGYADIVTLKKERKKQFVTDASNFYN
jgi:hypothetical protein